MILAVGDMSPPDSTTTTVITKERYARSASPPEHIIEADGTRRLSLPEDHALLALDDLQSNARYVFDLIAHPGKSPKATRPTFSAPFKVTTATHTDNKIVLTLSRDSIDGELTANAADKLFQRTFYSLAKFHRQVGNNLDQCEFEDPDTVFDQLMHPVDESPFKEIFAPFKEMRAKIRANPDSENGKALFCEGFIMDGKTEYMNDTFGGCSEMDAFYRTPIAGGEYGPNSKYYLIAFMAGIYRQLLVYRDSLIGNLEEEEEKEDPGTLPVFGMTRGWASHCLFALVTRDNEKAGGDNDWASLRDTRYSPADLPEPVEEWRSFFLNLLGMMFPQKELTLEVLLLTRSEEWLADVEFCERRAMEKHIYQKEGSLQNVGAFFRNNLANLYLLDTRTPGILRKTSVVDEADDDETPKVFKKSKSFE
jgi:hypothetical protein